MNPGEICDMMRSGANVMTETLNLAGRVHAIEYTTKADGPPRIEPISGSRNVLRAHAKGPVRGAFVGTLSESVTEVHSVPPPLLQGIAITFTVETSEGSFTGYYTGSIQLADAGEKYLIIASGKIISVTGAFAELFLADVIVNSEVPRVEGRPVGENGTLTISPR